MLSRSSDPTLLVTLSNNKDSFVRAAVASNRYTPTTALCYWLAKDTSNGVRAGVAGNPATPLETLIALRRDPAWAVRVCLADNPNTPADVLVSLFEGHYDAVIFPLVNNPNTPVEVIERFAKMPDDQKWREVRVIACKRLGISIPEQTENGTAS